MTPSNQAAASDVTEIENEVVEGKRDNENAIARQQAIDQARAAGILGSTPGEGGSQPLDKSSIRAGVKTRLMEIQICYEKALLEKPELAGTTLVEFTIVADGKVGAATATGFDAAVDNCVAGVIKGITFPKPATKQLVVKYPFSFKPAS